MGASSRPAQKTSLIGSNAKATTRSAKRSAQLPSATIPETELHRRIVGFDTAVLPAKERAEALDRFLSTPSGRQKPSRFWRVDLDTIVPDPETISLDGAAVRIANVPDRVVACDLATAASRHADLFVRAFGATD